MKKFIAAVIVLLIAAAQAAAGQLNDDINNSRGLCGKVSVASAFANNERTIDNFTKDPRLLLNEPEKSRAYILFQLSIQSTTQMYQDLNYIALGFYGAAESDRLNLITKFVYDGNSENNENYERHISAGSINTESIIEDESPEFKKFGEFLNDLYNESRNCRDFSVVPDINPNSKWGILDYIEGSKWLGKKESKSIAESKVRFLRDIAMSPYKSELWNSVINSYISKHNDLIGKKKRLKEAVDSLYKNREITEAERAEYNKSIDNGMSWAENLLDSVLRQYLFDIPVRHIALIFLPALSLESHYFRSSKRVLLKEESLYFSRLTSGVIHYTYFPSTRENWFNMARSIRKHLNKEDYENVKTQAAVIGNAIEGLKKEQMMQWP